MEKHRCLALLLGLLFVSSQVHSETWILTSGPTLVTGEYPFPADKSTFGFRYEEGPQWVEVMIHSGEGLFFRQIETGPCPELELLRGEESGWYLYRKDDGWEIYLRSSLSAIDVCSWFKSWLPEWARWEARSGGRPYTLMPATFEFP
jgi:hypothetical protein